MLATSKNGNKRLNPPRLCRRGRGAQGTLLSESLKTVPRISGCAIEALRMPALEKTGNVFQITEGLINLCMPTPCEQRVRLSQRAALPNLSSPLSLPLPLWCFFSAHHCTNINREIWYNPSIVVSEPNKRVCPGSSLPHWLLQYSSSLNICSQIPRRGLFHCYHPHSVFYWPEDNLAAAQTPRSL